MYVYIARINKKGQTKYQLKGNIIVFRTVDSA